MNAFLIYLLQVSLCTGVFYSVYRMILRKETFFTFNRFYMILTLLTSVLFPLFPVSYTVFIEPSLHSDSGNYMGEIQKLHTVTRQNEIEISQVLLIIYAAGAVVVFIRIVTQTIKLLKILFSQKASQILGQKVIENDIYHTSFSFFNYVFVSKSIHNESEMEQIIAHEGVHIKQWHSIDLLFVELLTVFFWFNPFIWLFERSVRQNHEYLADRGVLSRGHTTGKYQAMLVNQMLGVQVFGITNNLNGPLYSNRIKMMTKMKTPQVKLLRLFILLPVLAGLLAAFSKPEYIIRNENSQNNEFQKGGEDELVIKGRVLNDINGKPLSGTSILIKGTSFGTVSDKNGNFLIAAKDIKLLEKLKSHDSRLVFSYVGFKTKEIQFWVDGKVKIPEIEVRLQYEIIGIEVVDNDPPVSSPVESKNNPPLSVIPSNTPEPKLQPYQVEKVVEELPEYPGGSDALNIFMEKKLKKQKESLFFEGYNLSGKKIFVEFTVDEEGKVIDPFITKPDNNMYTIPEMPEPVKQKILTMVTEMPRWKPGIQHGKPVPVKFMIPLLF